MFLCLPAGALMGEELGHNASNLDLLAASVTNVVSH